MLGPVDWTANLNRSEQKESDWPNVEELKINWMESLKKLGPQLNLKR